MKCPQCGHEQSSGVECEQCGIIFSKWRPHEVAELPSPLEVLLGGANVLRLNENPRGVLSMLTGWEVAREFDVVDSIGRQRGSAAEQGQGVFASLGRTFFSGWLAVQFAVFSYPSQQLALTLRRPFFWFFSEITVDGARGERLGSAKVSKCGTGTPACAAQTRVSVPHRAPGRFRSSTGAGSSERRSPKSGRE